MFGVLIHRRTPYPASEPQIVCRGFRRALG
jgi:hypothetical protein